MKKFDFTIVDETSKSWKTFDYNGIPVPYIPPVQQTIVTGAGLEVKETKPVFITNLEQVLASGSTEAFANALLSMRKEIILHTALTLSSVYHCYEAPIAMSNKVPENHVFVDIKTGRIILNEEQALDRYIDSDGDRGLLIFDKDSMKDSTYATFVKWPISMKPINLTIWRHYPDEDFTDLTEEDVKELLENNPPKRFKPGERRELFDKKHTMVPIGMITNYWNCLDLYDTLGWSFEDKIKHIFNSYIQPEFNKPLRTIELEDNNMKAVRKEDIDLNQESVDKYGKGMALSRMFAPFLTSGSSIMKLTDDTICEVNEHQVKEYPEDWNLEEITKRVFNLNVDFREIKPGKFRPTHLKWIDGNMLSRLQNIKLIRYKEIPHKGVQRDVPCQTEDGIIMADADMPPAVQIWLTLPNGTPVGLTDVKRDQDEGMTYSYVLYPVWDNLNIYDNNKNIVAPACKAWVHPIEHLRKMLGTFDNRVMTFRQNDEGNYESEVMRYWPSSWTDFSHPTKAVKLSKLYQFLLDYCGRFGDAVESHHIPGTKEVTLNPIAEQVASITVVIDYGTGLNPSSRDTDALWEVAKEAYAKCAFCLGRKPPQKEESYRVGKYILANEVGGPITNKSCDASLSRGGQIRSQVLRSVKQVKLRVAIANMSTRHQAIITPSGVKKQLLDNNIFLPRVFGTLEEYSTFLETSKQTPEECPVNEVTYFFWNGEQRKCWTIDARSAIEIGKLVDTLGNKVVPRLAHQFITNDNPNEEIDLIMPLEELLAKEAHTSWLKNAKPEQMNTDQGPVTVWVTERIMFRTGAASENIPGRFRTARFKGIDQFPIVEAITKIRPQNPVKVDLEYPKALQEALRAILRMR